MMVLEMSFWDFEDVIARITREKPYTRDGLRCIYDYYNEIEEVFNFDWDLITNSWTEYSDIQSVLSDYQVKTIESLKEEILDFWFIKDTGRVMVFNP